MWDELDTANNLLSDFAAADGIDPSELIKITWERFSAMESDLQAIASSHALETPQDWVRLSRTLHTIIFDGFYSNAGCFRNASEPGGGAVRFGGNKRLMTADFEGSHPNDIETEFLGFAELLCKDADPVRQAVEFFQRFVKTHPFYDANGRIGRLMANIYLLRYDLTIYWGDFDSNTEFFKKLNKVHKVGHPRIGQLMEYVNRFVGPVSQQDSPPDGLATKDPD
jgi:fido (protein-threonine AMPylation protein)